MGGFVRNTLFLFYSQFHLIFKQNASNRSNQRKKLKTTGVVQQFYSSVFLPACYHCRVGPNRTRPKTQHGFEIWRSFKKLNAGKLAYRSRATNMANFLKPVCHAEIRNARCLKVNNAVNFMSLFHLNMPMHVLH